MRPSLYGVLLGALAVNPALSDERKDGFFAEARYHALQGHYFEALERLDAEVMQHRDVDEPERDTLHPFIDDAEFSLGDFELRYRMHHRAGRAITAVLEGAVDERVRNDAAYRLARIHFQKGQFDDALRALNRIDGDVPSTIRDDIAFLRANVHLARNEPRPAIDALETLKNSDEYAPFAAYNLGIATLADGRFSDAVEQLDKAGRFPTDDPADLAIRDKANLVLGTLLLEQEEHERAQPIFNRVRLDGPFSNQALLNAGWSSMSSENAERAVVPWKILAEREVTDHATQEAMLALPYAYSQLDIHGRAAIHYGYALDTFGAEIGKLNESIESIRAGQFLEALKREEIRESKEWVIKLRSLPDTPETFYLIDLMASHDFQTGLQNYLDLADLRRKLVVWQKSFDAFDDIVDIRHDHYEPLLPAVDEEFRRLDSRLKLRREQHRMLKTRLEELLTTPRPRFLATLEENIALGQIEALEAALGADDGNEASRERLRRLKGVILYRLETEYHERLSRFHDNVATLDEAMAVAQAEYDEYVRNRQAASHSYQGYSDPIRRLRSDVRDSINRIDGLMKRQGRLLELVAIEELMARRTRLEDYRDKARYALADSYDRATQSQAMLETAE